MSDYQETEATTPFGLALNELIKRFLGEGVPIDQIAQELEEAALRAGDEEEDENGEWSAKSSA